MSVSVPMSVSVSVFVCVCVCVWQVLLLRIFYVHAVNRYRMKAHFASAQVGPRSSTC